MKKLILWSLTLVAALGISTAAYATEDNRSQFQADVKNAAHNFENIVDTEKYNLSLEELTSAMADIFSTDSSMYNLSLNCVVFDNDENGTIDQLGLKYNCTPVEAVAREKFVSDTIDEIAALAEGETDTAKARIVYDYFLENYVYDKEMNNYNIYSLFKEKKGTCCSLSLAYKAVMDKLNIPCKIKVSNDGTHQWVMLGDKHIDIVKGLYLDRLNIKGARYRSFMASDAIMRAWKYNF